MIRKPKVKALDPPAKYYTALRLQRWKSWMLDIAPKGSVGTLLVFEDQAVAESYFGPDVPLIALIRD